MKALVRRYSMIDDQTRHNDHRLTHRYRRRSRTDNESQHRFFLFKHNIIGFVASTSIIRPFLTIISNLFCSLRIKKSFLRPSNLRFSGGSTLFSHLLLYIFFFLSFFSVCQAGLVSIKVIHRCYLSCGQYLTSSTWATNTWCEAISRRCNEKCWRPLSPKYVNMILMSSKNIDYVLPEKKGNGRIKPNGISVYGSESYELPVLLKLKDIKTDTLDPCQYQKNCGLDHKKQSPSLPNASDRINFFDWLGVYGEVRYIYS